ncbi:hypothetical protein [Streptomyces sp. NPDC050485]|uniref:hypothetical protein n=1 Tax=Streptomyces sp. NPDC050485 TaxID=3365617 RepID=UPI0037AA8C05
MRTLTIPLNASSPHARLVLADTDAGVAVWVCAPDISTVRKRIVQTGSVARHHAAELGEFLLQCPEPDYEPERGQDQATWLAKFVAGSSPRPLTDLDLRLNRGRPHPRSDRPQGLLRRLAPAGSPLLLTALNVPVLRADEPPPGHTTGAEAYVGHIHRLGEQLISLHPSAA